MPVGVPLTKPCEKRARRNPMGSTSSAWLSAAPPVRAEVERPKCKGFRQLGVLARPSEYDIISRLESVEKGRP
jgi:hypothetical protein